MSLTLKENVELAGIWILIDLPYSLEKTSATASGDAIVLS